MPTIIEIVKKFGNSTLRIPVAYGQLSCGHSAKLRFKPQRLACMKCGTEREREWGGGSLSPNCDACGCGSATVTFTPDEHRDEDRISQVGDEVCCEACVRYVGTLAALCALDWSNISHSRWRNGRIYVYQRDAKSPSGVTLALAVEARPEAEQVLREHRCSPLSPTEGLRDYGDGWRGPA